jgi:hypothetical protein
MKLEEALKHEVEVAGKKHIYIKSDKDKGLLVVLSTHNFREKYFHIKGLVENIDSDLLFVTDVNNSYYLERDEGKSYKELFSIYVDNYSPSEVTFLGSSMAGYAALYHGIAFNANILCVNPQLNLTLTKEFAWQDLKNTISKLSNPISLESYISNNIKESVIYAIYGDYLMDKVNANLLRNCLEFSGRLFIEKVKDQEHGYYLKDPTLPFKLHNLLRMSRELALMDPSK